MEVLRRVVIKEELVKLTGDVDKAVILNQFIYWSERVRDFDKFITEEKERAKNHSDTINIELTNGWIYKTADQMADEIMICSARSTARKMEELVNKGFLEKRTNPHNGWDRTLQYRVNLLKVIIELNKIGYALEGYPLADYIEPLENNICQNGKCISQIDKSSSQNGESSSQDDKSSSQNGESSSHHGEAIPENTTESIIESKTRNTTDKFYDIPLSNIWDKVKHKLKTELTIVSYDTWIKELKLVEFSNNCFIIAVCDEFTKGIIEARYIKTLHNAFLEYCKINHLPGDFNIKVLQHV